MRKLSRIQSQTAITVAKVLIYVHAFIWFLFAVITLSQRQNPESSFLWPSALFMFGNGLLFLFIGLRLQQKKVGVYLFALILLLINVFGTITDQLGTMDMLVLLISVATLILLMIKRRVYLPDSSTDVSKIDEQPNKKGNSR